MKDELSLAFTSNFKGRWGDMDAFGHVNNAAYLTYCEQVRILWMTDNNMLKHGDPIGPVMVTAGLTFLKPLVTPADIEVKLYAGDVGRSSFMTYHEIISEGVVYCTCSVKLVWVDYAAGKSVPLPDHIRTYLTSLG